MVISVLREHIADQNVSFVFPSQIASDLWARKTCTLGIVRSVAKGRFLAWDRFKEEVVKETTQGEVSSPSTSVMRRIFADALVRKNAKDPFLKSLIPIEYSGSGAVFAPFIARLLPSLAYWEKLANNASSAGCLTAVDAEDGDYLLVKKEYQAFLERYGLFEPSWEQVKTLNGSRRYVIFFPELIEDFAEYDALLSGTQFIRVGAETAANTAGAPLLVFYQSAREEIRSAVMEIQKYHEVDGVPYEDMAISIPETEEMEPYLLLELSLRHVPHVRRAGKKLGESGAGRLFSLVNEAASSRFSFNSLKALVLSDHIPWSESEKNKALVNFGIKYNCVSGYSQDGRSVDIWEEAFKEACGRGQRAENIELQRYYWKLKEAVFAIAGAESFGGIKKKYFDFWNSFNKSGLLDMEKISPEDDAVLSRCIAELNNLIELEERFNDPALVPSSPLGFLISHLDEIVYVRDDKKTGVNIYPWRAAAASPFSCHFVLNASQSAASVIYQPLKFLRQDKRKHLGLEDKDATGAFFLLCNSGDNNCFKSHTRISASAQTFSGWAIPHNFFAHGNTVSSPPCPDDPYRDERLFWKEYGRAPGKHGASHALGKIFPMQKNSYGLWKDALVQKENNFSFFNSPVQRADTNTEIEIKAGELIKNAIPSKDGCVTVTPTLDLNEYYKCSLLWLYKRVFKTEEFSLEAALLDDTSLGLLYHKILEDVFIKIKSEDEVFNSGRLEIYKRWALEITRLAIEKHPAFKGPLAIPLVSPQAEGMAKKIAAILELEAKFFNGYKIEDLELKVSLKTGEILIEGVIDRVSVSPEGEPVIIDYKTTYLPEQTPLENLEETSLSEFQMPLYIKLYEGQSAGKTGNTGKVQGAYFYSINSRRIKPVLAKNPTGRTKALPREEYEPFLIAAENQINNFALKVKALDFIPGEIRMKNCQGCAYKTVCRSAYFLNSALFSA